MLGIDSQTVRNTTNVEVATTYRYLEKNFSLILHICTSGFICTKTRNLQENDLNNKLEIYQNLGSKLEIYQNLVNKFEIYSNFKLEKGIMVMGPRLVR